MDDVGQWLEGVGLGRYAAAFAANDVDFEVLPELTERDLERLGVSLGHRKRLLKAIASLPAAGAEVPSDFPARRHAATVAEPERRQLTVLFCDLVGSTELSTRLDPEDLRELIGAYQDRCAGIIARFLGDGVLAHFGYPQAHEDDAERAVRAGLALAEGVGDLAPEGGSPLRVRVGIASGLVVVGDLVGAWARDERAVVGETPNLAARLQALAEPGTVVIGPTTRRLVGDLFECEGLGEHTLKGFAAPVAAWRVRGEGAAEGRFEALRGTRPTPLVGREAELALLLERWRRAAGGDGQVVLLSGEPGIGKSRLVRELRGRLEGEPYTPLHYQCSPQHQGSPLHPVVEQLERAAGIRRDDPPEANLDRLEALIAASGGGVPTVAPLLAPLLTLPVGDRYPPVALAAQRQRELTLEALVALIEGRAARRPLLLAFEDLHWADPTTLELLGRVIARAARSPLLAILTFRTEFAPPWAGAAHVTRLALGRLDHDEAAALADLVSGGEALPPEVANSILAKADGVPLFVEELTKATLEAGPLRDEGERYTFAGAVPPLAIPATLHDSLLARLDRFAWAKAVAQVGAAIGREFSHELLSAVAPLPEDALRDALDRLIAAELVFRRGAPPGATYSFKHALVRDAAYETLLRSERRRLHACVAAALEERLPGTAEAQPEVLAHHCAEAGLIDKAINYRLKAGELAWQRAATAEAVAQLTRGLELLRSLPDGPAHRRQELDLQLALGRALITARGHAAPETERAFARARELGRQVGEAAQLVSALWAQFAAHNARGVGRGASDR